MKSGPRDLPGFKFLRAVMNSFRQNVSKIFTFFIKYFKLVLIFLTIHLKLLIVLVEIKIVNKEAANKQNTLLHHSTTLVVHGRCTFEQSSVVLIIRRKQKKDEKNT